MGEPKKGGQNGRDVQQGKDAKAPESEQKKEAHQGAKPDVEAAPKPKEPKAREVSIESVFLADDVLPKAVDAFLHEFLPIDKTFTDADYVLDTNVLLLPYTAEGANVKEIIAVFQKLVAKNQLFIPDQVAREFIRNRPKKLGELKQQISNKTSTFVSVPKMTYSVLDGVQQYDALNEVLEKTEELKAELKKASKVMVKAIEKWEWNDPVHVAYRGVFKAKNFFRPAITREEAFKELVAHQQLKIPPGYKDASKDDLGVGDFLIWKTILELGAKSKKHLIFVSSEEKADWKGQNDLPRWELMDEYRRASGGKTFYIVPLSNLLTLWNASAAFVTEIKKEEDRIKKVSNVQVECPSCSASFQWRLAEDVGSSAKPHCDVCDHVFYIHRTRFGVTIPEKTRELKVEMQEIVSCPACGETMLENLGVNKNDMSWCQCGYCRTAFPIHRKADGSVYVSARAMIPPKNQPLPPESD